MDVFLGEWVNLLLRWAHMVVGIGWIGTSFYFMALDYSLIKRSARTRACSAPPGRCMAAASITSRNSPSRRRTLPPHLHWFEWEAYLTWVTGFGLLVVQYYLHAERLPDRSRGDAARRRGRRSRSRSSRSPPAGSSMTACAGPGSATTPAARDLGVRADPARVRALHQGVLRPRRLHPCRRASSAPSWRSTCSR